jgi:predicted Zn-dependent protease
MRTFPTLNGGIWWSKEADGRYSIFDKYEKHIAVVNRSSLDVLQLCDGTKTPRTVAFMISRCYPSEDCLFLERKIEELIKYFVALEIVETSHSPTLLRIYSEGKNLFLAPLPPENQYHRDVSTGIIAAVCGNLEEAEKYFNKTSQHKGFNARVKLLLAQILVKQNNLAAALTLLEGISSTRLCGKAVRLIRQVCRESRKRKHLRLADRAANAAVQMAFEAKILDQIPLTLYEKAMVQKHHRKFESAIVCLNTGLKAASSTYISKRDKAIILRALVYACCKADQMEQCRRILASKLHELFTEPLYWMALGDVLITTRELGRAAIAHSTAVSLGFDNRDELRSIAEYWEKQGWNELSDHCWNCVNRIGHQRGND